MFYENILHKKIKDIANSLVAQNAMISTAESCTGGLLGACFTEIPGSSLWFKGGIIAYSNEIKHNILSVESEILEKYGAVSKECVSVMAKSCANIFNTQYSISVSGIAGPAGGSNEKPVGLVWFGFYANNNIIVKNKIFDGDRKGIRKQAVNFALLQIAEIIKNYE